MSPLPDGLFLDATLLLNFANNNCEQFLNIYNKSIFQSEPTLIFIKRRQKFTTFIQQ